MNERINRYSKYRWSKWPILICYILKGIFCRRCFSPIHPFSFGLVWLRLSKFTSMFLFDHLPLNINLPFVNCELQIVDDTRPHQLCAFLANHIILLFPMVFAYSSSLHISDLYFLYVLKEFALAKKLWLCVYRAWHQCK